MMQTLRRIATGLLLLSATAARGQAAVPPIVIVPPPAVPQSSTGAVIGTVLAQDTQRPVRFAQVQLQNVEQTQGQNGGFGSFGGGSTNIRTDIDGTFLADSVAPGDYYVTATSTGYVSERALLQAQVAAGADPTALLSSLPFVHVTANATSNITVMLQRGGALAGHVEWEDGSPAAGVPVQASPSTGSSTLPAVLRGVQSFGGNSPFATTDDRGNFRMSGLATGDYVVSATIQPSSPQGGGRGAQFVSPVRVYAPSVFRKSKATAISVRAGDDRTDVRLILDLRGLHAVSGSAVSASPGQTVASGRVTLTDPNDAALQISGSISAQGSFRLPYVPPGTYTLQISGASTTANGGFSRRGGSSTSSVSFQPFSQVLVVSDANVSGVAVTLTPVAPASDR